MLMTIIARVAGVKGEGGGDRENERESWGDFPFSSPAPRDTFWSLHDVIFPTLNNLNLTKFVKVTVTVTVS